MMQDDITVVLAVTPDLPYPRYAAHCLYSLHRSNPTANVMLLEVPSHPDDYGWMAVVDALKVGPMFPDREGWLCLMDADSWVNGNLAALVSPGMDIGLRVSKAYKDGHVNRQEWYATLEAYDVGHLAPIYSNGVMMMPWPTAAVLQRELWPTIKTVRESGLPDPLHIPHRPAWWMADQYALSIICARHKWQVRQYGPADVSWNFAGEWGEGNGLGIVHHLGKKCDPFGAKQWPAFRTA